MQSPSNDLLQLTEEVAQLALELGEDSSPENEAKFAAWLARSPLHVEAFLRTTIAFHEFEKIDLARDEAKARVRQEASEPQST